MPQSISLQTALLALSLTAALADAADFDCVMDPRQVIEVRSPVEGVIEKLTVDRGDFVNKGQLLVQLDAAVERASAALALQRFQLEGAVRSGESRVEYSSKKHTRQEELYKQNFISAQARDEAATERKLAESELKEAVDNRRVAELEYKRQTELLRLKTITSPLGGVVMERLMHPGEVAEAGVGRKPILKIADIDVLHVEVVLPVEAYGKVKVGTKVDVIPDAPVGGRHPAVVSVVDRVLDAASGTFGVRLELPNRSRNLPAGMRCKASFASIGDDVPVRMGASPKAAVKRTVAPAAK
ncbi:MAG: efflux RND transporter periplasmic adaptor subunit [Burkholderiales bacterium]|nr:efflux RND transporter periplasmic adaptor subunit [Burkholderiales bacterium]